MTLEELLAVRIEKPDEMMLRRSKERWDAVAKPIDSLGTFEEMICRIAAIQGRLIPSLAKKALLIFCADNGIVQEKVSQSGCEVTGAVAALMGEGRSSVGILTKGSDLNILVYDVGMQADTPKGVIDKKVSRGTANFLRQSAMTKEQCLKAIEVGIEAARSCREKGYDILATGEMGIGNTTTSAALLCALTGSEPEKIAGRGAGLDGEGLKRKIRVIEEGLLLHRGERAGTAVSDPGEAFEALRRLGGLDLAALTGAFIGGALCHMPVVIDGLISAAAALTAERLLPGCREYMLSSHKGREKGMEPALAQLELSPVLCADLALGEGTGAVMLFPLLEMALSLYRQGTLFQTTQIGQYERFGK